MPVLRLTDGHIGQPYFQDGRHRVIVLRTLGAHSIPVYIPGADEDCIKTGFIHPGPP